MCSQRIVSRRVQTLPESETLRLNALVSELRRQEKKIINLTAGELPFATPNSIRRTVAARLDESHYTPTLGLPELRMSISKFVSQVFQFGLKSFN